MYMKVKTDEEEKAAKQSLGDGGRVGPYHFLKDLDDDVRAFDEEALARVARFWDAFT